MTFLSLLFASFSPLMIFFLRNLFQVVYCVKILLQWASGSRFFRKMLMIVLLLLQGHSTVDH